MEKQKIYNTDYKLSHDFNYSKRFGMWKYYILIKPKKLILGKKKDFKKNDLSIHLTKLGKKKNRVYPNTAAARKIKE